MQVTFKLTAEQLVRARLAANCLAAFAEEKKNVAELRLCGNLNVQFEDEVYGWNPDQNLNLEGDRLTYKGQRHPLIQDGALGVIAIIAGYGDDRPMSEMVRASRSAENIGYRENFSKLKIVSYQTSDARLYWFETVRSYLDNRGSWPEIGEAVKAGKHRLDMEYTLSRFPEKERLIRGLLSGDRKVHYEFSLQEIKEARELIRLCQLELI